MLKVGSKRRRTQAQVQADKEEALLKEQDTEAKLARLAEAEQKLAHYEQMVAQNEEAKAIISELQASGDVEIDDHGRVTPSKRKFG